MKLAAGAMLLCTMLAVGAQAVEQGTSSLIKELTVQPLQPVAKKNKAARSKRIKPKSKIGMDKDVPKVQEKTNAVTETPAESIEQSIQLKGVRG
jgi:hypothetical protein